MFVCTSTWCHHNKNLCAQRWNEKDKTPKVMFSCCWQMSVFGKCVIAWKAKLSTETMIDTNCLWKSWNQKNLHPYGEFLFGKMLWDLIVTRQMAQQMWATTIRSTLPNKSVHNKRMVQVLGMLTTNIGLKFEDNNQASECLSKLAWSFWLFEIASPSIRFCSLSLHVQFLPNLIESRFLLAFSNKVCANECTRANENVICARKHKTSLTSRHATFAAPNAHCNVFDLVELLCLVLLRMVFFAAWVVPMVHWCIH